jgi:hypothetical protein
MSRRAEPRISTRRDDLLAFPTGERPPAVPSNPRMVRNRLCCAGIRSNDLSGACRIRFNGTGLALFADDDPCAPAELTCKFKGSELSTI